MAVIDVPAQVSAQAEACAAKLAFGEDFGIGVNWGIVPTPNGAQVVFTLLLTMRSPLLGQGPLFAAGQIPSPHPAQDEVETCVGECARQLRELSSRMLPHRNGNAK